MTRTLRRSTRTAYPEPQAGFWPAGTRKPSPSTTPENAEMFGRLDADLFLANQLFRHGVELAECMLQGVTSASARREHIRGSILAAGLQGAQVLGASRDRPPESLSQAFLRLYGEPLAITGANAP